MRKYHLQHTVHAGPTCKSGRSGGKLSGEHITCKIEEFASASQDLRCEKCASSKLFKFLYRKKVS